MATMNFVMFEITDEYRDLFDDCMAMHINRQDSWLKFFEEYLERERAKSELHAAGLENVCCERRDDGIYYNDRRVSGCDGEKFWLARVQCKPSGVEEEN